MPETVIALIAKSPGAFLFFFLLRLAYEISGSQPGTGTLGQRFTLTTRPPGTLESSELLTRDELL